MTLRICVLTAFTSSLGDIAAISVPHMKNYSNYHDYEFRVVERGDYPREGHWLKIEAIRDELAAGFDFVLWLDVDTLIVRTDVDIRSAIQPGADLHMVWHDTPPAIAPPHFNTGVMLIRSSDWSRKFFERVWETGQLPHFWKDQAAILHLLGFDDILNLGPGRSDEPNRKRITKLDLAWNSMVGVVIAQDPIIHHYAGAGQDLRLRLMTIDEKTLDLRAQATPEIRQAFSSLLGVLREEIEQSGVALAQKTEAANVAAVRIEQAEAAMSSAMARADRAEAVARSSIIASQIAAKASVKNAKYVRWSVIAAAVSAIASLASTIISVLGHH
jgi:hypothetical protein